MQTKILRAEWDFEREVAVATETITTNSANPEMAENPGPTPTGIPRVEGNETRWLDVEDEFPPGYVEEYDVLLGPATLHYDRHRDLLVRRYPHAEFSVESIRETQVHRVLDLLARELRMTDFYAIREAETGTPIPENMAVARQQVRERADEIIEMILANPEDEVLDVDFMEIERQLDFPESHYPLFKR